MTKFYCTTSRIKVAGKNFKKSRLSCAVCANNTIAVAGGKL